MKTRWIIAACLLPSLCWPQAQDKENDVRIGVLGLFHPQQIVLSAVLGKPIECWNGDKRWPVRDHLQLLLAEARIKIASETQEFLVESITCDNGQGGQAEFVVTVPRKISRHYVGKVEIKPQSSELLIIIGMDTETAVASVVAAESPPHAPFEALKAQAVATRSFLVAGKGRHHGFDFCDTTHCQFLRAPPAPTTLAFRATTATRGLVLAYKEEVFAAMYSSSCGGRTHSLEELGLPVHGYPYFGVTCDYCRRRPEKWVAQISDLDAANLTSTEKSRLKLARKLGWKVLPSNSYSSHRDGGSVLLEGVGVGHGIGLCQRGAADMARNGSSFQQILEHYYPNTEVKQH
jgi:peptidoglycan hydrolase-like amidase